MKSFLLLSIAALALFAVPSCLPLTSLLTGEPVAATPVQRVGNAQAPAVLVSTSDLSVAEQAKAGTIYGLYDLGTLAEKTREVVVDATK